MRRSQHLGTSRPHALFVIPDPFLQPARPTGPCSDALSIPATYALRDYTEAGGLMSYGSELG